jgi:hypothetical protein
LSDTHFRKAKKITLVQDNLNIHKPASLYEAFPAAEARRLVERFEWHYTPKHGKPNPNSASYPANVSIAALPISKPWSRKSPHGSRAETTTTSRPIGSSPPPTPA